MAIAVKGQTFKSVLDVTSTTHNSIIVTRIELDNSAFRIILGYGPQENEAAEMRELFFTELEIEITECKVAGDMPVLIGDMNSKIDSVDEKIVPRSSNGKLLLELVENQEMEILNFDQRCQGKWTHVVRTTESASVLDYVIVSHSMAKHLKEITIDEERLYCPFSIKKKKKVVSTKKKKKFSIKKKVITPQYSDHNSIITTFKLPHTKKTTHKQQSWRLTDEGLHMFNALTSEAIFPTDVAGIGKTKYNNYEKLLHKTMNSCFQKTKTRKKPKHIQPNQPISLVCLM